MKNLPNFDVSEVMQAIIADEPDLADHQDSLETALTQLKNGEFARTTCQSACPNPPKGEFITK